MVIKSSFNCYRINKIIGYLQNSLIVTAYQKLAQIYMLHFGNYNIDPIMLWLKIH